MNSQLKSGQACRRTMVTVSLSFFMLVLTIANAYSMPTGKKINFSGTWVLNEQKSEFGEYGQMMAANKIIIVHKGKKMTMEKYQTAPTGESGNYTENYTLDGKECLIPLYEQSTKTSTVVWSEDKKSLIINSTLNLFFDGQEMKILTVETLSLQDGGKALAIKATASTDYGDMEVNFVYDLQ